MVEGNYFPLKTVVTHHNEMRTKGPAAIGKKEAMPGGESLEGCSVSLLLPNDIPVKVQG
jgi:hypothetical protein